jgi:glycosyltransferase involved in cell wall biosynthesis
VVFDSEALFSLRDRTEAHILGSSSHAPEWWERQIREEISLGLAASCVTAVTAAEAERFRNRGCVTFVVSHGCPITAAERPALDQRRDLLFVGSIHRSTSPNYEGLDWFVRRVLPLVSKELRDCRLRVAGFWSPTVPAPSWPTELVQLEGAQDDLQPLYDGCRVFVAPTRFGAGLPFKIHEAAAAGIPVCTTQLMAQQLGWQSDQECLAAPDDDPQAFARNVIRLYRAQSTWLVMRENALEAMRRHHSPERFREQVDQVLHHLRLL